MTENEFKELLKKYNNGQCTDREIDRINQWFLKIEDSGLELDYREREDVKNRIKASLLSRIPASKDAKSRSISFIPVLRVAASIAIIIAVGYLYMELKNSDNSADIERIAGEVVIRQNETSTTKKIDLPDGSTVLLNPSSRIIYPKIWHHQKREVQLEGEAFFAVEKDAERPFYVYGGSVVTKVLGTSFTVKAPLNAPSVEVLVRTGKVSVYDNSLESSKNPSATTNGVILAPNEKVKYFKEEKHWITSLVEEPLPVNPAIKTSELVFIDTPLKTIIAHISDVYAVEVVLEREALLTCTFTGDVAKMKLFDMLDVVCKSLSATYEIKGTKVLITGNGCQ